MNNILTIFKKEWDRVIHDRRLVMTVMILPGLMIFLIYTFLGNAINNINTGNIYDVAIVNQQLEFKDAYESLEADYSVNVVVPETNEISEYEAKIDDGEWDLLIIFPDNIATYDGTGVKPEVTVYANPNQTDSAFIKSVFLTYLIQYQQVLSTRLYGDTNFFEMTLLGLPLDTNTEMGKYMATLLPMLIIMFLFSGAMSIGPESIAGEKERGTISTLLVTPVKRSEIAIGKVLSLSVLSLISASSSFIGIMLSLPTMLANSGQLDASIYSVGDYLMILVLLFSTTFVIVGVISIISAYAKSLKEATSMILPIYIVTILVSISSMFGDGAQTSLPMYLIPIYNTVQTLNAIFTFDAAKLTYLLVTVFVNLAYLIFFIYVLNRMFKSEKIMFNK